MKGYVAFIDVLGFSALISGDQTQRVHDYLDCLKGVFEKSRPKPVEYIVFSDSLIITTSDDTDEALTSLFLCCSTLFGALLHHRIPVRGAISHGTYERVRTNSGTFVAGRAIIDAYLFEQQQDWVGIMLAPSTVQHQRSIADRCVPLSALGDERIANQLDVLMPWLAFVQPCNIPFHRSQRDYAGYAVAPSSGHYDPKLLRDSMLESIGHLHWLSTIAPDPDAQKKYQRPLEWLSQLQSAWRYMAERVEQLLAKK